MGYVEVICSGINPVCSGSCVVIFVVDVIESLVAQLVRTLDCSTETCLLTQAESTFQNSCELGIQFQSFLFFCFFVFVFLANDLSFGPQCFTHHFEVYSSEPLRN